VAEWRARKASGVLRGLEDAGGEQGGKKEKAEGDAWAALVNASKSPVESRANA
jgi:hypothetical protein